MDIAWKEIYDRLAASRAAIERESTRSSKDIRKILKARARVLAQEPADRHAAGETMDVLEFRLANESYCVELSYIQEVWPLKALTPVPGSPAFVLGIINVRGQVFSVIDLKKFFELPEKGLSDLNKVIIVQHNGVAFGILADAIAGVRSIAVADIQPSLPTLTGIRQEYLKGVTREQKVLLDAERLLSDESLIVNETGL